MCRSAAVLLAVAAVFPVGSASAEPVPAASAADADAEAEAVSAGEPYSDGPVESAEEMRVRVEDLPLFSGVERAFCSDETGPYQRQVEQALKLKVDGKQSPSDCKVIQAFQEKHGLEPDGIAGPITWSRTQLVAAGKNPNAAKKCPVRTYRVTCVDLSRQLLWVQWGKDVVFGPVPMRTGRAGFGTRTGWHAIYWRHKDHVSTLYDTPMPYSQFFSGGQAIHAVYGTIYNLEGSRGCVTLRHDDARKLWGVLKKGDRVYVWGRKPRT